MKSSLIGAAVAAVSVSLSAEGVQGVETVGAYTNNRIQRYITWWTGVEMDGASYPNTYWDQGTNYIWQDVDDAYYWTVSVQVHFPAPVVGSYVAIFFSQYGWGEDSTAVFSFECASRYTGNNRNNNADDYFKDMWGSVPFSKCFTSSVTSDQQCTNEDST